MILKPFCPPLSISLCTFTSVINLKTILQHCQQMDVIFEILMMMMMKGNGSLSATPRLTLPLIFSPMLSDQVVYQHAGWDCLSSYLTKDTDALNKDVFPRG